MIALMISSSISYGSTGRYLPKARKMFGDIC